MKKNTGFVFVLVAGISVITACTPRASRSVPGRYKARFEVAALCSNNTFSVIEGNIDTSLVEASWTNPQTGKIYKNAFAISNPCSFPATLKEGATFYFEIVPKDTSQHCAVCMAYYPTPHKRLNIKVIQ
ncbi:hypothetical protein A8C56_16905 [Niabella ginsenosidivorans]|uniref:Uncharacterized protein n=1 Tax=Niabella ginsenosidivorans TaxID=1176587 RepID=A0A1A9I8R9_9BACT|nr:hypothetical protein [Niabella ginsenosidivorans]ANH84016.1 hypothetical protein A8C56_16905 [Niabella ginsenosidivorans]